MSPGISRAKPVAETSINIFFIAFKFRLTKSKRNKEPESVLATTLKRSLKIPIKKSDIILYIQKVRALISTHAQLELSISELY